MNESPIRLLIVTASTREGRFGPTVARWLAEYARTRTDLAIDVLDLADARLPDALADDPPDAVAAISPRLAKADAFVVVTPEYNHSFPAPLKTLIDWHSTEWRAKPVGFVSYGGVSGGLRAVEQLRQVFAELDAVTVRDVVSFSMARSKFDGNGNPREPETASRAARKMLDALARWAECLRDARMRRPYGTARQASAAMSGPARSAGHLSQRGVDFGARRATS